MGQSLSKFRQLGHDTVSASQASGVNTITGEVLNRALKGAHVVVDVSSSPLREGKAAMDFFQIPRIPLPMLISARLLYRNRTSLSLTGLTE